MLGDWTKAGPQVCISGTQVTMGIAQGGDRVRQSVGG